MLKTSLSWPWDPMIRLTRSWTGLIPAAIAAAGFCCACADRASVVFPPNAIEFAPRPEYDFWWRTTEACSGLTADVSSIHFYVQQGAALSGIGETSVLGEWFPSTRQIFLASSYVDDGPTVRHEMLHALLGMTGGHPADYFQRRCGGIVSCSTQCEIDGGLDTLAVHQAAVAPLNALSVAGYTIPSIVDLDSNAGWWIAVIAVTNPTSDSLWVRLTPFAPGPPGPGSTVSEGLGAAAPADHWALTTFTPSDSVFLAPGQTMRAVADFNPATRGFTTGSHSFYPFFNTDTGAAVLFSIVR